MFADKYASNSCYDLLAYAAAVGGNPQTIASYPRQSLVSMDYIPSAYNNEYDPYGEVSHVTLVVNNGKARMYSMSPHGVVVGTWGALHANYQPGRIGIFTYAHQADFRNLRIRNITGATDFDNVCADPFQVCNHVTGLCEGGPSAARTKNAAASPTAVYGGQAVGAADFCPGPVGGDAF